MYYVFYDNSTGVIHHTFAGENPQDQDTDVLDYLEVLDENLTEAELFDYYVNLTGTPTLALKTVMSLTAPDLLVTADGTDTITITGIPSDTKATVFIPSNAVLNQPPAYTITDGNIVFSTPAPGFYQIELAHTNYKTETLNIVAQ